MNTSRLWITWETQRRNEELAQAFDCTYVHLDFSASISPVRYLKSAWFTLQALYRHRPRIVFCQCPSVVLCLFVALARVFFRFTYVIDAHNIALEQAHSPNFVLQKLVHKSLAAADFVIVSNENLTKSLNEMGIPALVLPDKLPTLRKAKAPDFVSLFKRPIVVLISTFASDEPIETFLKAAQKVDLPFTLLVTGRREKAGSLLRYESERIRFTDFLSHEEYDGLIGSADLLVDLTTREDCLVCGAYEAVAARTPALLSDTEALRKTFNRGMIFSKNNKEDFREALEMFLKNPSELNAQITSFAVEFERFWQQHFELASKQIEESLEKGKK